MKRRKLIKLSGISALSALIGNKLHLFSGVNNQLNAKQPEIATTVEIDWQNAIAKSSPLLFGSNDYEITLLKGAQDIEFQSLLAQLNIPLIRIHHADLSDRWTNEIAQSWDEPTIKACYDASYPHKPTIVQTIPLWPKWMKTDEDGLLATSEYDNYATFCADLVKIINQNQQRQVLYWEPFNELDKRFEKAGKLNQLWSIYNKAAEAMKAQDPTIKVGGPVMTWDNPKVLTRFLQNCSSNVDFISWHRYGTGNLDISTDKLMSRTSMYKEQVRRFRSLVSKHIPDRKIPLFLSEYNINYSWKSGEMRQTTHIGAVWFASVLKHLAEAGIEMATSWHLKDNIYGMIDRKNNLRPVSTVFAWGNKYLIGTVVKTESNSPQLESLAVDQESGKRSLLLINKSSTPARVNLQILSSGFSAQKVEAVSLDEHGINNITDAMRILQSQSLSISPYSLTLFKLSA